MKTITIDTPKKASHPNFFFYLILANPHRLDDFICMKPGKEKPGQVYDLLHFVQAFYKSNIDNNNTKTQN